MDIDLIFKIAVGGLCFSFLVGLITGGIGGWTDWEYLLLYGRFLKKDCENYQGARNNKGL